MLELVSSHGNGFKPPSYHEIKVKYLNQQVDIINDNLENIDIVGRKFDA